MSTPNFFASNLMSRGVDVQSVREALRAMRTDMIADGVGSTVGIHDVGVFYVRKMERRFVVRTADVFDVPERNVLKLRPPKSDPTKLTVSDDVRITITFNTSPAVAWRWDSTTRSGQFTVNVPTAYNGNAFQLVRDDWNDRATLVLIRSTQTDSELQSMPGVKWASSGDEVLGVRLSFDLLAVADGSTGEHDVTSGAPLCEAEITGPSLKPITDPTDGREALAWFRQRSLDISER